jgi:hypothetical protein
MSLQEEARNYGWRIKINNFTDPVKTDDLANSAIEDFIAGANSEFVRKEKIQFALTALNKAKDLGIYTVYNKLKEKL